MFSGIVARALDPQLRGYEFESNFGQTFTLHWLSSLSCVNEKLAIDSGGYFFMNSLRTLISTWLDVYQRSQEADQLNRSASELSIKCFEQS